MVSSPEITVGLTVMAILGATSTLIAVALRRKATHRPPSPVPKPEDEFDDLEFPPAPTGRPGPWMTSRGEKDSMRELVDEVLRQIVIAEQKRGKPKG